MDTPSLSPTSERHTDQVMAVLEQKRQPMRTEEIIAALPDLMPVAVRTALSRLGRRGKLHRPGYGVWTITTQPRAARPPHPRTEIVLPGATSEELRQWAGNVETENPVTSGIEPFRPGVDLIVSDEPFMGVELTFMAGKNPVFTLAIFADIPTEEEREIMDTENVGAAGF